MSKYELKVNLVMPHSLDYFVGLLTFFFIYNAPILLKRSFILLPSTDGWKEYGTSGCIKLENSIS